MLEKTIIQKALIEIIEERVHKVAWEKAKTDEFYIKCVNESINAFDLLSESLTTDKQRELLDNLESALNFVESLMQGYAYRQGLQDSQMIHRELSEFGVSVTKESVS